MIFFVGIVMVVFSVGVLLKTISFFGETFAVISGRQTKTNTLSDGSGGKSQAQALKDKKHINPISAVSGALGLGAGALGVAAGAAGKILPGAAGLAFKGAKLGVNAAKMAGGGLAAGAEALNKATGLTRKISGFAKPIGDKIRFTVKEKLEEGTNSLKNKALAGKRFISNSLPEGFKRGITGINNGLRAGARFTRNKARASLEEMKANREEWKKQTRRTKEALKSALQDTNGYKLFKEGLEGIIGPKKLPKKSVFHAKYGKNSFFYQEREDSNKLMTYNQMKNLLESEYAKAALTKDEIATLTSQMNADYKTHGNDMRYSLSSEYKERIRKTKEMLNSSYGQRFAEAFEKSNNETEAHALKIMQAELGKNQGFRTVLEGHIKNELGDNASRQEIQETRQKILGDITKSIMNNGESIGDISASDFLSENDMRKLSEKIGDFQYYNKNSNIIDTQKELIKEYASAHPEATHEDVKAIIKEQTAGIAESLTRLQQATPRTEVVSNTTQTQAVQATGNTANNTVVNTTTVNNNVQNNATNNVANNATGTPAATTSAVSSSTSTTASNSSGNNTNTSSAENARTVHTTVVQRNTGSASSIDVKKLTNDISEGLRAGITKDVTKNMSATLTSFIENFKDGTLKDFEKAIKNNGLYNEFKEAFGGENEMKRKLRELYRSGGTIDDLSAMLKSKSSNNGSGKGGKNNKNRDAVYNAT